MSAANLPITIHFYTKREEIANALTHGAGALIAAAGLALLIITAIPAGAATLSSFIIYGTSLLAMYAASTVYHAVRNDTLKIIFRKLDHCAIYLLIAGTYTPLMLLSVGGSVGLTLLCIVWSLAGIGITVKCFTLKSFYGLSLILYLVMGWLCIFCIKSLVAGLTPAALVFLVAGGAMYTIGVIFYLINKPYSHTVWHLFVLSGTTLHFFSVYNLVG